MSDINQYTRLRPICVNYDCDRPVAMNRGKPRPHCSACQRARWETGGARKLTRQELKENPYRIQPSPFHKFRCSNSDGRLGFQCPCRNDLPEDFRLPTDLDHIDGNTWNNNRENVMEICRLCHVIKGKKNGDMKGFRYMKNMISEDRIEWERLTGLKLRAKDVLRAEWAQGLSEKDMDPIQAWSESNNCGTRLSFDTWRFRDDTEITMFLLKWG